MSPKSAEDTRLMRTYSVAAQCIVLLQELSKAHPDLKLPQGVYGAPNRPLDRVCNFLVTELQGVQKDTGFDPSAGETHLDVPSDVPT